MEILIVLLTIFAVVSWIVFCGWFAFKALTIVIKAVLKEIENEDRKN